MNMNMQAIAELKGIVEMVYAEYMHNKPNPHTEGFDLVIDLVKRAREIGPTNETTEIHGRPIGQGDTVSVDHSVQDFHVQIRSLSGISTDTLKNLIQTRYEVTRIAKGNTKLYVQKGISDFPS